MDDLDPTGTIDRVPFSANILQPLSTPPPVNLRLRAFSAPCDIDPEEPLAASLRTGSVYHGEVPGHPPTSFPDSTKRLERVVTRMGQT